MDVEWTLDQTLAWVYWRDMPTVETLIEGSVGNHILYPPEPYRVEHSDIKHPLQTEVKKVKQKEPSLPWKSHGADFHYALRTGQLRSRGRKRGEGDREIIKPEDWRDLLLETLPGQPATAQPDSHHGTTYWTDIKIPCDRILRLFPEDGSDGLARSLLPMKVVIVDAGREYLKKNNPIPEGDWRKNTIDAVSKKLEYKKDTVRKELKPTLDDYQRSYQPDKING